MGTMGEPAYIYAKASSMLAKSFIGERAAQLFAVRSISELWALIFDTEIPALPESFLAKRLEQEAEKQFLNDFMVFLRSIPEPDSIYLALLRFYDYDNLKDIAASLCLGKRELPDIADIGRYSMLNYDKWPDIAAITEGSPVSWYKELPDIHYQQETDLRLDREYIRSLWHAVLELSTDDRLTVGRFIKEELVMQNILWALRLKVYYGMNEDDIRDRLVSPSDKNEGSLVDPAIEILPKKIDSYAEWDGWKYAKYLNPHEEGVIWKIDPRWVQQSAKIAMHKKALSLFHREPDSAAVLVTWFKIKQYELDCIRTAADGLLLNIEAEHMEEIAGLRAPTSAIQ